MAEYANAAITIGGKIRHSDVETLADAIVEDACGPVGARSITIKRSTRSRPAPKKSATCTCAPTMRRGASLKTSSRCAASSG